MKHSCYAALLQPRLPRHCGNSKLNRYEITRSERLRKRSVHPRRACNETPTGLHMSSRRPMPPLKRRERDDEKAPYALLLSSPSRISSFSCTSHPSWACLLPSICPQTRAGLVGILVVLALAMLSFGRTRSLRTEEDPSELYVRQPGATKVLSDGAPPLNSWSSLPLTECRAQDPFVGSWNVAE
eukprot:767903-Hanusia_phi.AAC.10